MGVGAEEEVERTGEKCDATARRRSLKQAGWACTGTCAARLGLASQSPASYLTA